MRPIFILFILIVANPVKAESVVEYCRSVPSENQTFIGVLITKTFAGEPKYESIENGDKPEIVNVLVLNNPTCVMFQAKGFKKTYINEMQIIDPKSLLKTVKTNELELKGSSIEAEKRHHYTQVILNVNEVKDAL